VYAFLENNLFIFFSYYVVAVGAWILSARLSGVRLRRAVRVSIIFLGFPILYLGHPFLFYQCWMWIVVSIIELDLKWLIILLSIWTLLIVVSTHTVSEKKKS
jgi:hypothetical protein